MKKLLIFAFVIVASAFIGRVNAQNCEEIVLPHINYNREVLDIMPAEKLDWYCRYSQSAFFMTDKVPTGAVVYDLTELVCKRDNAHVAADFMVDMNTFSYYAYNFYDFQIRTKNDQIYFRLNRGDRHKYLGVRTLLQMEKIANDPANNQ